MIFLNNTRKQKSQLGLFYIKLIEIDIQFTMQNKTNFPVFLSFFEILSKNRDTRDNVAFHRLIPAQEPTCEEFPNEIKEPLRSCFRNIGVNALFIHQKQAFDALMQGQNVVIPTGTSSGKTLVYQMGIFQELAKDDKATALLIYPTKALANDCTVKEIRKECQDFFSNL